VTEEQISGKQSAKLQDGSRKGFGGHDDVEKKSQ
jgi:hypothetical protein